MKERRFDVDVERICRGGVEGTTCTASFGGEDGGVKESQGCGVLGILMVCGWVWATQLSSRMSMERRV